MPDSSPARRAKWPRSCLCTKWLADKLGKDQATISKWVTNTTQPSLEALIAIANALEVPVQELVRQEEFNQEK